MTFDRFDIVEAYYCYAEEWHGGARSAEYALFATFNRLRFRPRPNLSSDTLSENGRAIFDRLVSGEANLRDRRRPR